MAMRDENATSRQHTPPVELNLVPILKHANQHCRDADWSGKDSNHKHEPLDDIKIKTEKGVKKTKKNVE